MQFGKRNVLSLKCLMLHDPNKESLSPLDKLKIATGMARGLEYLAAMHFVHDFKSQNVLLGDDMNTIICDFDISRITGPHMTTELGTDQWTAPEVLSPNSPPYDTTADIGIVLVFPILSSDLFRLPHWCTKQQHIQIMKKANDIAAKEESSILTKIHTALAILQQLSLQLFLDMLRLINQMYSIPVQ